MPRAALAPVRRGLAAGLVLGLLIGGLALLAAGLRATFFPPECAPEMSAAECTLQREISISFGRRQVWAGGALALMGVAAIIFVRGRPRREAPPTEPT